jgi:very-short-patch-repair endonuclease
MGKDSWKTAGDLWGKLKPRAREMRAEPTPTEARLWARLRNGQIEGLRFRRQHAIGPAIVDLVCADALLVVEIDGPIHAHQLQADRLRQQWLETQGLRVLRFSNDRVDCDEEGVVAEIAAAARTVRTLTSRPT